MNVETEFDDQGTRVLVRAFWGFAMLQKAYPDMEAAKAAAPAQAADLEARIRAAQS